MNKTNPPRHIAIIMDGNGRWAERRGVPRVQGHAAGADRVRDVLKWSKELGIEYLTLYAFSTENWKRSREEVSALMNLLGEFLDAELDNLMRENVRLTATGRIDGLPLEEFQKLLKVMEQTRNNTSGTLILALNYGGRAEIADAAKKLAEDARSGKLDPETIDESVFGRYLYHPEIPDPDLMIRTAGEYRLSNFLLWELSYAEFYVTETLWPDFDRAELEKALAGYGRRERRFGGRIKKVDENV